MLAKKTNVCSFNKVFYNKEDYSFCTKQKMNTDIDLMLGDLFLGADSETMFVKSVSGYNNFKGWINKKLSEPSCFIGELIITESIEPGLPKRISNSKEWRTCFDNANGWVCIGDSETSLNDVRVKFLHNAIAVLTNNSLKALWIKLDI